MILWLTPRDGYSNASKAIVMNTMKLQGMSPTEVVLYDLHSKAAGIAEYKGKKMAKDHHLNAARHALSQVINQLQPKCLVINDEATLRAITGKPYTLSQTRGSVYYFEKRPCIVLDNIVNLYRTIYGQFQFGLDFSKIFRFATGAHGVYPEFRLHIPKTVAEVEYFAGLARGATMISTDTETHAGFITCVGFTFDVGTKLITVVIPYYNPYEDEGCYWRTEEEESTVRRLVAEMLALSAVKAMQNGMYDCAYFVEAASPPINYFLDCSYMMHSIWIEAPKRLHNIASYFLDNYVYWKDEAKGEKEETFGHDPAFMHQYWRYNGLDCYYTWLSARELLSRLVRVPWAVANYNTRISLAVGPCLAASLRGVKINKDRHAQIIAENEKKALEGIEDMRRATNEPAFNCRSPYDVAWWLYDVLGVKITRLQRKGSKYGPRSTDEKVLKLIKEQRNPVANNFIARLLRAKKPANVVSKFGKLHFLTRGGRFLSWLNPTGTISGRFNSGESQFWRGTNGQNLQQFIREMFVADDGWVLVDIDYAASDDVFVAYESEDPDKIATVTGPLDTHCKHCSVFFSKPYKLIEEGWKNDEDWVVAEPQGLRQITKKIAHGRNYLEGAATMYNLMGRDAVVATAIALGHPNANAWTDKELIGICAELGDKYDHPQRGMYKRLRKWHEEITALYDKLGGTVRVAFGMTMKLFGMASDPATQRKLASLYGQGGTAGNINRSLLEIFYSGIDDGYNCLFLLQVHDSCVFAVRRERLDIIATLKEIMEKPTKIHNREMHVPASPKVGLSWGKKMLKWTQDITYAAVLDFERQHFGEKYKPKVVVTDSAARIAELEQIDFYGGPEVSDDELVEEMEEEADDVAA